MQNFLVSSSGYSHSKKYNSIDFQRKKIAGLLMPKTFKELSFDNLNELDADYRGKCAKLWEVFDRPTQPTSVKYQVLSGKMLKKPEKLKKTSSIFRTKTKSTENKTYTIKKMTLPPLITKPKSIFQHWEVDSEDESYCIPHKINIFNYLVYKSVFS